MKVLAGKQAANTMWQGLHEHSRSTASNTMHAK
jgi:hypothetical protein